MSPETHRRVRQLFDEALERPAAERTAFLRAACGGDFDLFGQVAQLLAAQAESANFLKEEPAWPQHIGRYLVTGELGRGAMGIVYEAIDPLIGRKVAVKVIRLAGGSEAAFLRDRLFREARSAGGLFHPGIAVILDVGQDGDVAFIAMECVEGPSLAQVMAACRRVDRGEALQILQQTAAALDFAHGKGVVHRDIKPANIMLDKGFTVKVADFGIAKITSAPQYTQTGMTMGTPSYMSPEQVEAKALDGKSDQFSLAVVAYELLTGEQPFQADSFMALAHTIVYGPRPSARAANPELPAEVDQVFYRGLGKLPEERYWNCREFVAALERALTARAGDADDATRVTVKPLPAAPAVRTRGRKLSRYIVGGSVAALLLAAAGLVYIWLTRRQVEEPQAAAVQAPQGPPAAPVTQRQAAAPRAVPAIARFLADPRSIEPGTQTTLSWVVSGTSEVDVEPGIGKKPAAYSVPVAPAKSTRYELTAANAAGTTRGEAFVEVKPKAAEPDVATRARQLYRDGESKMRAKQFADGVALLRKAGELGDTRAMLRLGDIYGEDGEGHVLDEPEAARWFRKAADVGDAEGMLHLGGCYELGAGVPASDELAVTWYRKASDSGDASATYNLAKMYESGRGIPRDTVQARILYQRAADMGEAEAKAWIAQHGGH